jgi:hypothetical protein
MLTRDDGEEGGYHDLTKAKAGYMNRELLAFLRECHGKKVRDVSLVRSYFEGRGIDTAVIASPFTHAGRRKYFDEVRERLAPSSLVLLDPDNGLETGHPDEKHLLFSELASILGTVDEGSLVMIFQYYPRVNHGIYRRRRVEEILRRTGHRSLWITDNQILFFLIAKAEPVRMRAGRIIDDYTSRYPGITMGA